MANWINYDSVIGHFMAHGFDISGLEIGALQRVKRTGSTQKGWYILREVTLDDNEKGLIGSFGYWDQDVAFKEKISPAASGYVFTKEQKEAMKKQHAEATKKAQRIRNGEIERAAGQASRAWAKYVVDGESDYLARKGVKAYGLRFSPSGNGTLAIPIQDTAGRIFGLQVIRGKNRASNKMEKEYWPKGLKKQGNFHLIGGIPKQVILIVEGEATGATLHEATDLPVAVAFDSNNLLHVAVAIHKKYPRTKILICGDDDYLVTCKRRDDHGKVCMTVHLAGTSHCSKCNQGLPGGFAGAKSAEAAANAVHGEWMLPRFPADRQMQKLTDFNDLAQFPGCSLATVRQQVEDKLAVLDWPMPGGDTYTGAPISAGGGVPYQRALSVMDLDDLVARFIPIDDGEGECVFDTRTHKVVKKTQMVALMPAGSKLDDIKRHYLWESRGAFYLDEIGFDPTEKDEAVKLNLWRGWPMQPKKGDCSLFLELLLHLCSKESHGEDLFFWVLKWMALPLQQPGAKMASALIFHGPQGTGKSLIFSTLAKIYGQYASKINNEGINDKFNTDWTDSKLFVLAEEIANNSDKWNKKNDLKDVVTGDTIRVRGMFKNAYLQKNHINFAFLSNEDMPLPLENDDRRHCVVYTPPSMPKAHYGEVLRELENGGIEAFYEFLLNQVKLDGFTRHTLPPKTQAKENLIGLSLASDRRFISEWSTGKTDYPVCPVLSMDLYAVYLRWCKLNGETHPRPSNAFLGMVNNLTDWDLGNHRSYGDAHYSDKTKPRRTVIPSDAILAAAGREMKPDKNKAEWVTDGIIDFKDAMHNRGND